MTWPDIAQLRERIVDLEATLQAIREIGVDSVVAGGPGSERIYPLTDTGQAYRATAEAMGEGAATVSERGVVLYVNPMLAALLARDRRHLVGAPVTDMFGAADQFAVSELLAVSPGATTRAEANLRRPDGALVPVLLAATCLDLEGVLVRCLIATDLTDRKEAELALAAAHRDLAERAAQLERSNHDLARSNAELAEFAHAVSHDLSEPLRSIAGFAQLLLADCGDSLTAEAKKDLDFITSGVARMHRQIDDLLTYSRIDTQAEPPRPVALDEVVAAALTDLHAKITEAGAVVRVAQLPTVTGSRPLLAQVFANLIRNALTFVPEGCAPTVDVGADRTEGAWRCTIADNGIGIPAHQREMAFRMFQRLHGHGYPGTGIGLAVCRKAVERHGGRIWVEDNPGGGSRFCFTIPDVAPGGSS